MKIILDTDFLLNSIRNKIDLSSELRRICDFKFEICVLEESLKEIEGKKDENIAKELIKKLNIEVIMNENIKHESVDDILLRMKDAIVATQDKELKKKLKEKRIKVITIRQKKHLVFC